MPITPMTFEEAATAPAKRRMAPGITPLDPDSLFGPVEAPMEKDPTFQLAESLGPPEPDTEVFPGIFLSQRQIDRSQEAWKTAIKRFGGSEMQPVHPRWGELIGKYWDMPEDQLPPELRHGPLVPFPWWGGQVGAEPVDNTLTEWAQTATSMPTDVRDFLFRVVPTSAAKTVVGIAHFFMMGLPKDLIHPFAQAWKMEYEKAEQEDLEQDITMSELGLPGTSMRPMNSVEKGLARTVFRNAEGLLRFMGGEQLGLFGWEDFKRRWLTDPVGAAVGLLPILYRARTAYSRAYKPGEAVPPLEFGEGAVDMGDAKPSGYPGAPDYRRAREVVKRDIVESYPPEFTREGPLAVPWPQTDVRITDVGEPGRPVATPKELRAGRRPLVDVEPGPYRGKRDIGKGFDVVTEDYGYWKSEAEPIYRKKAGGLWRNRGGTNIARKAIERQEGVETVPVELEGGGWQLVERNYAAEQGWIEEGVPLEEPKKPVAGGRPGEAPPEAPVEEYLAETAEERVAGAMEPTVTEPGTKMETNRAVREAMEAPPDLDEKVDAEIGARRRELDDMFLTSEKDTFSRAHEFNENPKVVESDIELYTMKLINDVNRVRHGDTTVDITDTRKRLSWLASHADEARSNFLDGENHFVWKTMVQDAAEYARVVSRMEPRRVSREVIRRPGPETPRMGLHPDDIATLKGTGKRFTFGVVNLLDGKIEETATYAKAEAADWHHNHYLSQKSLDLINKGEAAHFWIEEGGVITSWPMEGAGTFERPGYPGRIPVEIKNKIREQIDVRRPGPGEKLYAGLPSDVVAEKMRQFTRKVRGRLVRSVNRSQKELLKDILVLHNESRPIDADFTYSKGVMWKGVTNPKRKYDIKPQTPDTVKMDVRKTGLPDGSVESAMFDPPFLIDPRKKPTYKMAKRFGVFRSVDEANTFYRDSLNEMFRVIEPGGKLVVKIQDTSIAGKRRGTQVFSSAEMYNFAREAGFEAVDRFIYENDKGGFAKRGQQRIARKVHSSFWVFEKPKTSEVAGAVRIGLDPKLAGEITRKILERTKYGVRTETADRASRVAGWSNASGKWGLYGRNIKRGEEVKLDANEILIPAKQIKKVREWFDSGEAPVLPLFGDSFEARHMDKKPHGEQKVVPIRPPEETEVMMGKRQMEKIIFELDKPADLRDPEVMKSLTKQEILRLQKELRGEGPKEPKFKPGDRVTVQPQIYRGRDIGPGIPEGWSKRYFDPFFEEYAPTPEQVANARRLIPRKLEADFGKYAADEFKSAYAYFDQQPDISEGMKFFKALQATRAEIRDRGIDPKVQDVLKEAEKHLRIKMQKEALQAKRRGTKYVFEQARRFERLKDEKKTLERVLSEVQSKKPVDLARVRDLKEEIEYVKKELDDFYGKFYTGPPIPDGARKVHEYYDKVDRAKRRPPMAMAKDAKDWFKSAFIDTGAKYRNELFRMALEGKREALDAAIKYAATRGASARATKMFKQYEREIFRKLSRAGEKILGRAIFSRRTMQLDAKDYPRRGFQHPAGLGGEEHRQYIDAEVLAKANDISVEAARDVLARVEGYFEAGREQLKMLLDEEIIDQKTYDKLKNFDYSRRQMIDMLDPEVQGYDPFKGRRVRVRESGIEALKRGKKEELLEYDARLLLADLVFRTQARIMHNRANKALWDLAAVEGSESLVRRWEKAPGKKRKVPNGWAPIEVMIDGKARQMIMPNEMANAYLLRKHEISQNLANLSRALSGSIILRPMATGLNVGFALANFPRDIMHIWLSSDIMRKTADGKMQWESTYSEHLPVFLGQMARDLGATVADAALRKGRWNDFIDDGAGMEFMVHQGRHFRRISPTSRSIDRIYQIMGYISETSEIWTRLALRERALRRGATPEEASWIARAYLDFGQGGSIAKAMDTAVPYLNPGIQGTRGIVRTAMRNPKAFGRKVGWLMGTAIGLYLANKHNNKEAWDSISDSAKERYWIITTPWKYQDEYGMNRHIYFKVAKDQGQMIFAKAAEAIVDMWTGEEVDVDGLVNTMQELIAPIDLGSLPPSFQSIVGYLANKDFWRNEDIWRGQEKIDPKEEYWPSTHPGLVQIGQATGLSPERLGHAMSRLFTQNNVYTYAVGQAWKKAFGGLPQDQQETALALSLGRAPITGRVVGLTGTSVKTKKELEDVEVAGNTRRWIENRGMDVVSEEYMAKRASMREVRGYIKQHKEKATRERLFRRFKNYRKVRSLPPDLRRWMASIVELSPEDRADAFLRRWRRASDEEKADIRKGMAILKGPFSSKQPGGKRFWANVNRLQRQEE